MRILDEIVEELDIHPKVARIDAELDKQEVIQAFRNGKIENFETRDRLSEQDIDDCIHIVAQMGIQPYMKALEGERTLL